jgi:hypothetical protein
VKKGIKMEEDPTKNKLSYKIKIPIIILTLVTLAVMGALFIKIAFSVSSSEKKKFKKLSIFTKRWGQT